MSSQKRGYIQEAFEWFERLLTAAEGKTSGYPGDRIQHCGTYGDVAAMLQR
jgi:hypothetical protein